jgi:hypothetical protein
LSVERKRGGEGRGELREEEVREGKESSGM